MGVTISNSDSNSALEVYIVGRLEKAERTNLELEQLNRELNHENLQIKEMLAAIGEHMELCVTGDAIWTDSIMHYDSMFNRIVAYFNLREKWEAKHGEKDNSD